MPGSIREMPLPASRYQKLTEESIMRISTHCFLLATSCAGLLLCLAQAVHADQKSPQASIDGTGPGWKSLGKADFVNVNGNADTWSFKDGTIFCTGTPVGVMRSARTYKNFKVVLEWRHMRSAGNSGVFVWAPEKPLFDLKPGQLPQGIEIQILDHGYAERFEKRTGKKSDWFTTNGDVFPTGSSKMTPFPPAASNGRRSFPSKNLSKGVEQWNHYYIRCINGEVRLWVNGTEVSGGSNCNPADGYLCLESEGSPIEFRGVKLRELP
uniref:Putative secreted glycosyl hydrolase n=1 Tax=uncultured planctomycete 3FN TaxID=455066 RepID=A9LGW5_9BACT|nr:putative secreted glycosyl hydrolase [uncultured planctomycete 3FN]